MPPFKPTWMYTWRAALVDTIRINSQSVATVTAEITDPSPGNLRLRPDVVFGYSVHQQYPQSCGKLLATYAMPAEIIRVYELHAPETEHHRLIKHSLVRFPDSTARH